MDGLFMTPENRLDTEERFIGSFQQLLSLHKGEPVIVDLLVGVNNVVTKSGILFDVGEKYLVLHNTSSNSFITIDFYTLKIATFPKGRS